MKILVVNPPGPSDSFYLREGRCMHKTDVWTSILPPISLVLIGTILKNAGFNVLVIDAPAERIDFKKLKEILEREKFDLLYINTATPTIESDLSLAKMAKTANSKSVTVAFGIHVSVMTDESFRICEELDMIIKGEPEITALEIANALRDKIPLTKIKGISFQEGGRIIHNPDRPWLNDLNTLPIPDWSLVPYKNYILPLVFKPYLYVLTSRGCPYKCTFCAQHVYYGREVRLRKPDKIVEEIKVLKNKYNIIDFMFWADTFTIDRNHTIELCDLIIKEKLDIRWTTTTRVDLVDEELLKAMKSAGCWLIVHGIESGREEQLDRMQKNITIPDILRTITLERNLGIKVIGHFIIGYPDETEEDIEKTIEFALSLPLNFAQFYFATPFPGSELYNYCLTNNLLTCNDWRAFEQDKTVIANKNISEERLVTLRNRAYKKFYLRPKIIFENLPYFVKPSGIKYFLKNGRDFFKFIFH